ncbi:MAG: response regulator [Nitrospirae bacterium]|nr:MAG: response regulator [Nitrospirota bacterium]
MVSGTKTILLVDDIELLLQLNTDVLTAVGYTVLSAENADEALRICREHPGTIDLLLTDVKMPGLNGRELAEQAMSIRPGLKVLFMSGAQDTTVAQIEAEKPNFLPKPFTPTALIARVRGLLGR